MQTLDKPPSCLYQAMQTRETFSKAFYTMMWIICALWLVVAHDLSEDRYMADVTENLFWLFCSTLRVVLKMFVRLFWVKASESLKKISRSYLQRRKMEKQRQKEPFTTRECLNYKKSSQLLPLCCHWYEIRCCGNVLAIILLWGRKDIENFSKKLYTHKMKNKRRSRDEHQHLRHYSQTRSSVPVANELMNSFTEKWFRLLIQ